MSLAALSASCCDSGKSTCWCVIRDGHFIL
ncbi:MAG: hypothetical protein HC893_15550 [Chloroflexaceae bacterium]|nr:hypothetical protein [Chloroflexaceae bacterium]NJL34999.1 hypothetical protein [Chloroflexaceae bacterium]NJO07974.1 hypothetical protein [Chloroflexaceae bacterium]